MADRKQFRNIPEPTPELTRLLKHAAGSLPRQNSENSESASRLAMLLSPLLIGSQRQASGLLPEA
jgi:hypothetical protein